MHAHGDTEQHAYLCCTADEAERTMRAVMARLKLTVNDEKTRVCRLPDESFFILGPQSARPIEPWMRM